MTERIPNFNTLSTLIDRLIIENVKLAHFQNSLEHDSPDVDEVASLKSKIDMQGKMIEVLKKELSTFLRDTYSEGQYTYMKEERTFK